MKNCLKAIGVTLCVVILSSCATIMQGTRQNVGVSSSPAGASITIDNKLYGKTPLVADLSRKDNHIIKIEMSGYLPYEVALTRNISGWVLGNVIFGGVIGLVIDVASGGLYKLTPDQVNAELKKENLGFLYKKDNLYIAVVLTPKEDWQKVGGLKSSRQ